MENESSKPNWYVISLWFLPKNIKKAQLLHDWGALCSNHPVLVFEITS